MAPRLWLAWTTAGALCALAPHTTAAAPQGNASLTLGGAGTGTSGRFWEGIEFHLGVRGDALFLREDGHDFGLGPYVELGTLAFDELQVGGGLSVLLPVDPTFPLIASVGPYARVGEVPVADGPSVLGAEPGFAASLFWGSRSYNFDAGYEVVWWGVSLGFRQSFGESHESAFTLALQFDLALAGMPMLLLAEALSGPSAEAAPIEPLEEP